MRNFQWRFLDRSGKEAFSEWHPIETPIPQKVTRGGTQYRLAFQSEKMGEVEWRATVPGGVEG